MKRFLALALIAVLALTLLAACDDGGSGNNNNGSNTNAGVSSGDHGGDDTIVGIWKFGEYNVYEFKKNGTIEATFMALGGATYQGTYSINGGILSFTVDLKTSTESYIGKFRVQDGKLYLYENDACANEFNPGSASFINAVFTRVN